uniref:Sema domain-containing protein n=1 Tax=Tetranychus urticae TaxID=32264 RepID=A0A158P4T8_TETUR
MFLHLPIWVFKFCLLVEITYSFRTPKHDIAFYYKTIDSVFLTNPTSHTTSYGIYVAGQTITIDIPTSVANVSDILDWKVVNINAERLMFVHKKKPRILINQKEIKEIEYSGEMSDSIIAFGDNEALHVPTIFNPNLTGPVHNWNYLELLHFDDENEKVSVSRSLPWLKDDWKYIKEWKMTDYIHFENKLYLAIKRSISNANSQSVTQEISIIRLCLGRGIELISSAVEIHFSRPEFNTNQITDLIFVFIFGSYGKDDDRYQLHTTQLQPNNTQIYHIYYFRDIVPLFEQTANECASGSDNINLLQYHLRSKVGKCIKTSYKSCLTKENIVPSKNVTNLIGVYTSYTLFRSTATFVHKIQFYTLPYPHLNRIILLHTTPLVHTAICEYLSIQCLDLYSINSNLLETSSQAGFHINRYPFGYHFIDKETNEILFIPIEMCSQLKTCTQCIMYGLYFDCIWSNSKCIHDTQPKNKAALTVGYCFKISNIYPLIFNSSLPTKLTIQLDRPLIKDDQEQLVIQAGLNRCTKVSKGKGSFINCSMRLKKSGQFKVNVSLRNDRYADAAVISAVSTDKVKISAPGSKHDYAFVVILLLFSVSFISLFLMLACANSNNKNSNEFLVVGSSKNFMKMAKNIRLAFSSQSRSRSYSTWRSSSKTIVFAHPKSTRKLVKYSK